MSIGTYRVEDYTIRLTASSIDINTPTRSTFKISTFDPYIPIEELNEDEVLVFEHVGLLYAKARTERHLLEFFYIEDPDEPNGMISLSEWVGEGEVPNTLASQGGVSREVILTIVSILSQTEHCQQYRIGGPGFVQAHNNNNNNGGNHFVNNVNNGFHVPINPWNNNASTISNNEPRSIRNWSNTNNNSLNGGKRKQKRKTRKTKRT
jgi:hypothetical protein